MTWVSITTKVEGVMVTTQVDTSDPGEAVGCVCGNNRDFHQQLTSGVYMLDCDSCHRWSHCHCVGIWLNADVPNEWYCATCRLRWSAECAPQPITAAESIRSRGEYSFPGAFPDLDGLAVRHVASFLQLRGLTRAACACHALRTACAGEIEHRARAQISLSWYGSVGLSAEEASRTLPHEISRCCINEDGEHVYASMLGEPLPAHCRWEIQTRPYSTSDLIQLAADYAGGWGPLLARREGVGVLAQPEPHPIPAVNECLLLWDIVISSDTAGSQAIWSGVCPLVDELNVAFTTVDDINDNEVHISICNVTPFGASLPGSEVGCPWWDTRESVGPWASDDDCVMSSTLFELLVTDLRHCISLLAPGRGEVLVCISFQIGAFLKKCFRACPASGSADDIDAARLSMEFGTFDDGEVICSAAKANNAKGDTIPDTFDFELHTNTFRFGEPVGFWIDARIHVPTSVVRYMILFTATDEIWQRVLDMKIARNESDDEVESDEDSDDDVEFKPDPA